MLGDPLDPATSLGPVVSDRSAAFVRGQIAEAKARGARALIDEARFTAARDGSRYVAPQVLVGVDHAMGVMREESFGPVIGIMRVASDDEAVALMNDSHYGLTAAVWTADEGAALAIGDRLATGTVFMNRCDYLDPALAWTGGKRFGPRLHALAPRFRRAHAAKVISPTDEDPMNLDALRGNWNYPTSVRFGVGRVSELAEACRAVGMKRPLLVTDPGLAKLSIVADAVAANRAAGVPTAVFSDIRSNPVAKNVEDGLRVLREGKHDGVVAFGGGSALDAGKVIAFMSGQTRPMWDFEDVGDWWTRADPAGIAPIVAVPTTAGTGSEVGRAGVITDESTHTKKIIFHPKMMPAIVITDPALMAGLSPLLTAATGMDALAHNIEAYCAPFYHPMADGIALEGMRLVKENLVAAFRDGSDLAARAQLASAAMMGAVAFQKGLGAIHALSHPIGAVYDTHHGLTNAVFMPYVLSFNRTAIEKKIAAAARYLGLEDPSLDGFIAWTLELRKAIGVPHTLAGLNIGGDRFDELSKMAADDPTAGGNPIPLTAASLRSLYEQSLEGRV